MGMVAFLPSRADMARLALDGYELPDEIHITAIYLDDGTLSSLHAGGVIDAVVGVVSQEMAAFQARVFGISIFNPDSPGPAEDMGGDEAEDAGDDENAGDDEDTVDPSDGACLVLLCSGEDLAEAQDILVEALESVGVSTDSQHQPWIPHLTLAYDASGTLYPLVEEQEGSMGPLLVDRIRVIIGQGEDAVVTDHALLPEGEEPPEDDEGDGGGEDEDGAAAAPSPRGFFETKAALAAERGRMVEFYPGAGPSTWW